MVGARDRCHTQPDEPWDGWRIKGAWGRVDAPRAAGSAGNSYDEPPDRERIHVNKKLVGVIAAVVMAIVGTGVLVPYVQGAEDRALAGEALVRVLTVTAPIPARTSAEQLAHPAEEEGGPVKAETEGAVPDLVT